MSEKRREQRRPPKGLRYVVYAGLALVVFLMVALGGSVFLFGSGPAGPPYPGANFQFEYDRANGTVLAYHAGGQNLTAETTDRVTVRVNDTANARFALPVVEGDGVTISGVDLGQQVEVVWHANGGATIAVARTITGENNESTADGGNATTTAGG